MNSLLILGTVAFDAIETPFGKTEKILGGAATYIALSASHFDLDIATISVVGSDFPKAYLNLLSDRNINVSGIEILKDEKTFFWSGRYHNNMNNRDTLITELNALLSFNPIVPNDYKNADVLVLGNLDPKLQLQTLNQMTRKPKLVILDTMNFWIDSAIEDLHQIIKHVDVITINDEEARQLTSEYALISAAEKIQAMGPKYVIIKKGEHGALLFYDKQIFHVPALPLKQVFDPTGAGDTFAGGFAGYIAKTGDTSFEGMKNGIIYGSALASFCVEKFGTKGIEKISRSDIEKRLLEFKNMVQFDLKLL